jgi:hypothetical protein
VRKAVDISQRARDKTMAIKTAKDMRVTLQAIQCTNSSGDSGANLEIFGKLEARGTTLRPDGIFVVGFAHTLWSSEEGINIAGGTELPINSSIGMLVFKDDFLEIGGRIVEEDDFVDDTLGNGFRKVSYDAIKNEIISVGFNSENQEVVARFLIDGVVEKMVEVQ